MAAMDKRRANRDHAVKSLMLEKLARKLDSEV